MQWSFLPLGLRSPPTFCVWLTFMEVISIYNCYFFSILLGAFEVILNRRLCSCFCLEMGKKARLGVWIWLRETVITSLSNLLPVNVIVRCWFGFQFNDMGFCSFVELDIRWIDCEIFITFLSKFLLVNNNWFHLRDLASNTYYRRDLTYQEFQVRSVYISFTV